MMNIVVIMLKLLQNLHLLCLKVYALKGWITIALHTLGFRTIDEMNKH